MVGELDALDPKPGEEVALGTQRTLLRHAEQIASTVHEAAALLTGELGAEVRLSRAVGALERVKSEAAGHLDSALAALERAAIELGDALAEIAAAGERVAADPGRLEGVEERVFALRAAARKHQTSADELAALRDRLVEKLAASEDAASLRAGLSERAGRARDDYRRRASKLTKARTKSARKFDMAVMAELRQLKLDKALFRTVVTPCEEADWTAAGADRTAFEVATIPGLKAGPLSRVASGGELSRLLLALKVVLAGRGGAPTLVFDEVDRGVGGATAAAVGERLSDVAREAQVLGGHALTASRRARRSSLADRETCHRGRGLAGRGRAPGWRPTARGDRPHAGRCPGDRGGAPGRVELDREFRHAGLGVPSP